jgi:hypothetical protein
MSTSSPESPATGESPSQPEQLVPTAASFLGRVLGSLRFWWCLCVCCAAILAMSGRHLMNPDGLTYLDMASEALRSGPSALLNGLWSPGYPALISLALGLFHPAPSQEFPLLHLVNFLIFVATLWAFHFFLRHWLAYANTFIPIGEREKKDLAAFAYFAFLWFTLEYIDLGVVGPDLCMTAAVFLVAGIVCRLALPGAGAKHYVLLGVVSGLGYYAKAPLFPLGLVLFGALLLYPPSVRVGRPMLLLSLSIFLLVAAPLVMLLSERVGHLSMGEAGRLNLVWYSSGAPNSGWTGDTPAISGSPQHPPRKLMEKPLVLEFGSPVPGTFPLWYDPSYWYAGAQVRFDPRKQIAMLKGPLAEYKRIFAQTSVLFAGALVLGILAVREKRFSRFSWRPYWLLIWPLAALLMYALIHVESRYVAVFFVLLWLAVYGALMARVNRLAAIAICATVAVTMMIPFTAHVAAGSGRILKDLLRSTPPDYEAVAAGLRDAGVHSGDRLAVVGWDTAYYAYYARYERAHIVAEIPSADEFWNLSAAELQAVTEHLTQIGVKALVAANRPAHSIQPNWRDVKVVGPDRFSILQLPEPRPQAPPR